MSKLRNLQFVFRHFTVINLYHIVTLWLCHVIRKVASFPHALLFWAYFKLLHPHSLTKTEPDWAGTAVSLVGTGVGAIKR